MLLNVGVFFFCVAHRTVVSTAVLVPITGFVLGDGVTGVLDSAPEDEILVGLAKLALWLHNDGMLVGCCQHPVVLAAPRPGAGARDALTLAISALLAHGGVLMT